MSHKTYAVKYVRGISEPADFRGFSRMTPRTGTEMRTLAKKQKKGFRNRGFSHPHWLRNNTAMIFRNSFQNIPKSATLSYIGFINLVYYFPLGKYPIP